METHEEQQAVISSTSLPRFNISFGPFTGPLGDSPIVTVRGDDLVDVAADIENFIEMLAPVLARIGYVPKWERQQEIEANTQAQIATQGQKFTAPPPPAPEPPNPAWGQSPTTPPSPAPAADGGTFEIQQIDVRPGSKDPTKTVVWITPVNGGSVLFHNVMAPDKTAKLFDQIGEAFIPAAFFHHPDPQNPRLLYNRTMQGAPALICTWKAKGDFRNLVKVSVKP